MTRWRVGRWISPADQPTEATRGSADLPAGLATLLGLAMIVGLVVALVIVIAACFGIRLV